MTTIPLPMPGVGAPLPGRGCDCTRCAFWAGPDGRGGPATVEPLCSGTNSDCSYCGCAATEGAAPRGACTSCPIRCGSRTDIAAWMADVKGTLAFDDIAIDGTLPALPSFIPMTDGAAVTELDRDLRWPAYGIGLRRVFSQTTHTLLPRFADRSARDVLALNAGQKAVLVGYGQDPLVEALWTRRRRDRLIEQIAAQQWDVVLAPNFSVYGNWPRAEHLLNMRRCLLICQELADAGVMAVPNLYWFRLEDLVRYTEWIADAPPPAVAVNLQTVRENTNWESWALPGLCWLAENLPASMPVVLTGLSRPERISQAVALFGTRLTVVSQNAHQYALHGAVMTPDGREDIHARIPDAFAATVRYMASLLPAR
ncbi:hypothetical protein BIV57_13525 [Mangrovactinospora gilvigrisea]|uniref:DUF4417 domain-containing protein n=1 Tax=Mangrovactinospora gilvigrisea TaxID=1428644 RepID=A0A1J7BE99_9ACTN|nr:DUF4417 domain-containing protein [Mangrovactinospora gilvigrisea]OIV37003.1 hypothetical protein BIV57_13525 [Mangrovactinospora gilvigrisea]